MQPQYADPRSVSQQLLIFLLLQVVDQLHVIVGDLLDLLEALPLVVFGDLVVLEELLEPLVGVASRLPDDVAAFFRLDRKSTRLNSSHLGISYAVFCLKKKT